MKDKQVEAPSGQARIPVVSAVLHCVSMSILVYLRSSFGFAYLGPKSVFFAFSWAFILFAIYAWMEPDVWTAYRAVWIFGVGAVALYWGHLVSAILRELDRKGEHDFYSGMSHALRFVHREGSEAPARMELKFHLWAEPTAVLVVSSILRFGFGERRLSEWLLIAAVFLWFKEGLNYWHRLRTEKRQEDVYGDVGDTVDAPGTGGPAHEMPIGTRKQKVRRARNPQPTTEDPA